MGKRGPDKDADEDDTLWARVVETARPLRKGRVVAKVPPVKPKQPAPKPAPAAAQESTDPPLKIPVRPKPAPLPRGTSLDRGTARKLETGRLPVEARLDLHGMRARDAHVALKRFLRESQGRGYRNVLVITGKGTAVKETRSFYEEEARGVLRQSVPHWLSGAEFADLVISFAAAPRRLGGEGALYVRVRKPR
jgi:DNA-nicking Smr family endonuclease